MTVKNLILSFEGKDICHRDVLYFNDVYECEYLGNPLKKPTIRLLAIEVVELLQADTVVGYIWYVDLNTKKVNLHVFFPQPFNLKYLTTKKPEYFDKYFNGEF